MNLHAAPTSSGPAPPTTGERDPFLYPPATPVVCGCGQVCTVIPPGWTLRPLRRRDRGTRPGGVVGWCRECGRKYEVAPGTSDGWGEAA